MLAVKEALNVPDAVFAPVVMTDGLFAYSWMSLLIACVTGQERFDAWTGASTDWERSLTAVPATSGPPVAASTALILGALGAVAAVLMSPHLPPFGGALTPAAWAVLLSTTGALIVAGLLSRAGRGVSAGTEKAGNFLLLILVASLGARVTLSAAARSPVFLAAGLIILLVHGAVLLWGASFPLALAATTSQACIGGVVSTPMVAAVYRPALAVVGLLLAVAANAVGTYVGLLTAVMCRWVMK